MAENIESDWDKLLKIITDHVLPISNHCLSKGLISNDVYDKMLKLNTTPKEKARELLVAICDTVDIDKSQFKVLTEILKKVIPSRATVVIADIRKYHQEQVQCDPPKVRAIKIFIPKLVHVIGDSVEAVSDHCLSNGLIKYGRYREIIFSEKSPDSKARMLLRAVMESIRADHRCFNLFVTGLKHCLPTAIHDCIARIVKAEWDKFTLEPAVLPREVHNESSHSGFCAILENFEIAITKLDQVNREKEKLKQDLESKIKQNEALKAQLRLNVEGQEGSQLQRIQDEIIKLTESLKKKEEEVEEHHTKMKRERAIILEQNRVVTDLLWRAGELEGRVCMSFQQESYGYFLQEICELRKDNSLLQKKLMSSRQQHQYRSMSPQGSLCPQNAMSISTQATNRYPP